jgi:hypothetical protein
MMEKTTQRLTLKNNEGNKIKKNKIVWACITNGLEEKNECNCSRRNPGKELLGRPRYKRENGVDMILK